MAERKTTDFYVSLLAWLDLITFALVSWAPTTSASTLGPEAIRTITRYGYFALALLIFVIMLISRLSGVNKFNILISATVLIYFFVGTIWVYSNRTTSMSSMILCMLFSLQSDETKNRLYSLIKRYFFVMSAAAIICYASYTLHGLLPYRLTEYYATSKHGVWYADYYFSYLYINSLQARACGLFNEPGWFGTFLGFYLCAEDLKLKKIENIVVLIAGLLSFSLAFFVIVTIYFVIRNINDRRKWILIIALFAICATSSFIQTGDAAVDSFLDRISIAEILSGKSRSTDEFNIVFHQVMSSPNKWLGMGSGYAFSMAGGGSLSIKINLIDFGIIGTTITFLPIFILLLKEASASSRAKIFLLCVAISQYQRPWIFEVSNFMLVVSALTALVQSDNDIQGGRLIRMGIKRHYRELRRFIRKIKYGYKRAVTKNIPLRVAVGDGGSSTLFITNDNYGGTRQYENLQRDKIEELLILRRISYGERRDLIFELENCRTGIKKYLKPSELQQVFQLIYRKIVINTLVHTTTYESLIRLLTDYKITHPSTTLIYLVHDFNSVCPNCNLFVRGHYCGLNCSAEKCKLLIADECVLINDWRDAWHRLLSAVDEVRCFSDSSRRILLQAYGDLDAKKMTVVPHDTSYIKVKPIQTDGLPLHIGIIGDCDTDFKGRQIVEDVINRFGDEIPITLAGSDYKGHRIEKKKVFYLGKYERDNLGAIITEHKISEVLFPSICPETFSYLLSELIALEVPIIAFNMGAQGEKVGSYPKGILCDSEAELFEILDKQQIENRVQ